MNRRNLETLEDLLEDVSFQRWISGEAEDSQALFWEEWVKQARHREELVKQAAAILKGPPFSIQEPALDPAAVQRAWERLRSQTKRRPSGASPRTDRPKFRVRRWWRIAAGLALLIGIGAMLEFYVLNPLVEYRTPFGKQLTITLPDSTIVELNANSLLTYRENTPRKVWLDGEAFFEVKKQPKTGAHFWVYTNDLTVEVLGTAFNVVEKEDKTEVILEEGSVQLNLKRNFEQALIMQPGDLVTFSAQATEKVEQRRVKAEVLTSWKDGVLEFEDVPLTEVMERIKAIYGWEPVYYNKSLKNRKISIGLPSEDLENAILLLSKSMNMQIEKVEQEEKTLLLR